MTFDEMRLPHAPLAEELRGKILRKLPVCLERGRGRDFIPYTVRDGDWAPAPFDDICWWTNGFWPGLMWEAYLLTGEEPYRLEAERAEAAMDAAFLDIDHLHHDVGFMWLLSAGAQYRLMGTDASRKRMLHAATLLAGRFNPCGFLRAWNGDRAGWAIIDSMMNLCLLYHTTDLTGDPRFGKIAMIHADTAMRYFIRPDGSSNHIVVFDPETMAVLDTPAGQGCEPGSQWSRGQAWALYGFTLSHLHTGREDYLATARRVADHFIDMVRDTWVPRCDFCQSADDPLVDACAGAVAASGLIELGRVTGDGRYCDAAASILRALDRTCSDWSDSSPAILTRCTGSYHGNDHEIAMVYADFFFVEAVRKLLGDTFLFW